MTPIALKTQTDRRGLGQSDTLTAVPVVEAVDVEKVKVEQIPAWCPPSDQGIPRKVCMAEMLSQQSLTPFTV